MDLGFPGQVTTTVTVTTENTSVNRVIRYDPSYVKTIPGRLKIAQVVLDILGFICIMSSAYSYHSRGGWFNMVAMFGMWISLIALAFYMFHVIEKLHKIPWLRIELLIYSLLTVLYFSANILVIVHATHSEAYGVASVFGIGAMCAYGYDAFLKYNALKNGDIAQGQRQTSKPISTVGSPVY